MVANDIVAIIKHIIDCNGVQLFSWLFCVTHYDISFSVEMSKR